MMRFLTYRSGRMAAIGLLATLAFTATARALIPLPYVPPPGVITGDPEPDPPTDPIPDIPPPDDDKPPPEPCVCDCEPPGNISNTPEPATMVSAAMGALLLGGYALRRRSKN